MSKTIVCEYCGSMHLTYQPYCTRCGAPINPAFASSTGSTAALDVSLVDSVLQLCRQYDAISCCYTEGIIPEKKLRNARQAFGIPPAEQVLMLCDNTVFGSNKDGLAICAGGLYWKNDWATETKRTFLPWGDFAQRDIKRKQYHLSLGQGDRINTAAMLDADVKKLVKLLEDLQTLLGK